MTELGKTLNVVVSPIAMVEKLISQRFHTSQPYDYGLDGLASEGHLGALDTFQEMLWVGVKYVLDTVDLIPVLPIYAEEKGLKVRYPTCTLTAANLCMQVLRRAADAYFIRDPRCAGALGGTQMDVSGLSGDWYSQDATAATDYHPHWLTTIFYEEVINRDPRLEKYRPYLHKLLGPKYLLDGNIDSVSLASPFTPAGAGLDGLGTLATSPELAASITFVNPAGFVLMQTNPVGAYTNWLRHITKCSVPYTAVLPESDMESLMYLRPVRCKPGADPEEGSVTTVGEMMGDPTSFPLLFCVSLFSLDMAFTAHPPTPRETKERKRRRVKGLRTYDHRGLFCGDDALLAQFTPARRATYDHTFGLLGGRLQPSKSYYHKRKGLFTEQPFVDGKPQPFTSISVWSAPPGGSKGQINWFNQPVTASDRLRIVGRSRKRGLWRYSPFVANWGLAHKMGIPLGASISEAGLELPPVSKLHGVGTPDARLTRQLNKVKTEKWLGRLGSLSLVEVGTGTGLSLLPKASTSVDAPSLIGVGSKWVKSQLVAVEDRNREFNATVAGTTEVKVIGRGPNARTKTIIRKPRPLPTTRYHIMEDGQLTIPISDVPMRVASSNLSWDLLFRPLRDPIKTPSIRALAQKLDRKLERAPHVPVESLRRSYKVVHAKLEGMKQTRVLPEFIPTPGAPRSYGLEKSPVRVRRGYRSVRVA